MDYKLYITPYNIDIKLLNGIMGHEYSFPHIYYIFFSLVTHILLLVTPVYTYMYFYSFNLYESNIFLLNFNIIGYI